MDKTNSYRLFSYDIDCDTPAFNFKQKECISINCLNPHSYVVARNDQAFKDALMGSDILLPDGDGIVYGIKRVYGANIRKIAGEDLQRAMLEELNRTGGSCLYFGTSETTLKCISDSLKKAYPNVHAHFISPIHFSGDMPEKENQQYIDEIRSIGPDVVFVGLGTRKQETWIYRNQKALRGSVSYICGIGAAFDMIAGTYPRAPRFFIDHHCEWLYRLVKEPRRMWRRNFISSPIFLRDVTRFKKEQEKK